MQHSNFNFDMRVLFSLKRMKFHTGDWRSVSGTFSKAGSRYPVQFIAKYLTFLKTPLSNFPFSMSDKGRK